MTLSMYETSVPAFRAGLSNLSTILVKAAAQCVERGADLEAMLTARLAPDMLPLARQVMLASDFAKMGAAKLAGREPPVFEDIEKTAPELQARIARTLSFLDEVSADELTGSEAREVTLAKGEKRMSFDGRTFLLRFALPNFYFHVTTAYAILRRNGIELSKTDYLGSLR